ncbi:HNH endonuclease [Belliella sp. R4-6]|uniref:HNH endonuclease n=1 Tax=Belliella alkalica TaxID=1730871 RepID=A0ABS9VAW5_9BACT|nr:HNH endonuclease signature motif containing protein [Belliella alkalica]MCH7413582.1 HNH endonuclease [Belliella alkalica]
MKKPKYTTVKELIFWSYANLAMAHSAVDRNQEKYNTFNYVIRAKLFKGLKEGTMKMRSIFDDEKIKLKSGQVCNYCGGTQNLALDHIFPQKYGGLDTGENLIFACRSCNSSKGKKDLMQWMSTKENFLPLMVIRRYLKLTYVFCDLNDYLDLSPEDLLEKELPIKLQYIPTSFPKPVELLLSH